MTDSSTTFLQGIEQEWINSSFGQQFDTSLNAWAAQADPALSTSDACGLICNGADGTAMDPNGGDGGLSSATAVMASASRPPDATGTPEAAVTAVVPSTSVTAVRAAPDTTAVTAVTAASGGLYYGNGGDGGDGGAATAINAAGTGGNGGDAGTYAFFAHGGAGGDGGSGLTGTAGTAGAPVRTSTVAMATPVVTVATAATAAPVVCTARAEPRVTAARAAPAVKAVPARSDRHQRGDLGTGGDRWYRRHWRRCGRGRQGRHLRLERPERL